MMAVKAIKANVMLIHLALAGHINWNFCRLQLLSQARILYMLSMLGQLYDTPIQ